MRSQRAGRTAVGEASHGIDRMVRYNMETGPPLLVTMVGGMGLLAAILRREE